MTIGNLRGMKDSARLFGIPTYLFLITTIALIVVGIFKVKVLGVVPHPFYTDYKYPVGNITILLFLKAFASGCTALTGIEAVSDGIPNFKELAQKNAKSVLLLLATIILVIFGGIAYLSTLYTAIPGRDVTALAQIAHKFLVIALCSS